MKKNDIKNVFGVSEYYDEMYLKILQQVSNKDKDLIKYQNLIEFFLEFKKYDINSSLNIPDFVEINATDSDDAKQALVKYKEYIMKIKDIYESENSEKSVKKEWPDNIPSLANYPDCLALMDFQIEYFKVLVGACDDFMCTPLVAGLYNNREIMDKRLYYFCEGVVNQLLFGDDFNKSLELYSQSMRKFIGHIIEKNEINDDSLKILLLFGKELLSILNDYTESNNGNDHLLLEEVYAYLSYYISDYLYGIKNEISSVTMYFAKRSLNLLAPVVKQDAFNNLGLLAILMNDWQLANDVYYSWISMGKLGDINEYATLPAFWGPDEKEWRESPDGKKARAQMYANLAYVRGTIGDTYEIEDDTRKKFYDLALDNIQKAKEDDPEACVYSCTYGTLLLDSAICDLNNPDDINNCIATKNEAYAEFQDYKEKAMKQEDYSEKLCSNRVCCNILRQLIFLEVCKDDLDMENNDRVKWLYDSLVDQTISYCELNEQEINNKKIEEEIRFRNDMSTILYFSRNPYPDELVFRISIMVLAITENVNAIKKSLQRREYLTTNYDSRESDCKKTREKSNEIAYYTTLKNIMYLFDELYIDNGKIKIDTENKMLDTKNCLTVMNSKYMNDPNEGLVILKELMKNIDDNNKLFSGKNAKKILQSILDDNHVFLKSFTEQVDILPMWNRYANDYSGDGNNSNGCCVVVNPESFACKSEYSECDGVLSTLENIDDYSLYRIVYLSSDGSIDKRFNDGINENVRYLYEKLKTWMTDLNNLMIEYESKCPNDECHIIQSVEDALKVSLLNVLFLFKNTDYADEHESRLILFRNSNNQNDIRIIPGTPPLLALNAYFQIYIDEIILGPNVREVEKWRPYFQYQLNKMWKKNASKSNSAKVKVEQNYHIKKSNIDYMT